MQLAVQLDGQLSRRLHLGLEPLQAEQRMQALRILTGQQGQADDQRDKTQGAEGQRLACATPVTQYIQQGQRRQQTRPAPQQTRSESTHHQPDQAGQNQQQTTEDQQRIHSHSLSRYTGRIGAQRQTQGSSTLKCARAVAIGSVCLVCQAVIATLATRLPCRHTWHWA
ncbi:hypothetical protein D3C84_263060 [compost metagenome]